MFMHNLYGTIDHNLKKELPLNLQQSNGKDSKKSTGINEIFLMEALMMLLEQDVIKSNQSQSEQSAQMGQVELSSLQATDAKIKQQIQQESKPHSFLQDIKDVFKLLGDAVDALDLAIVGKEQEAKSVGEKMLQNPALKWVGDVIAVAMILFSVATGQFELAAVAIVLFTLSETGALGDLTTSIAKGLEKAGLSDKVAKILADVLVIVIVTIATMGVGAAGSIETVTDETVETFSEESESELNSTVKEAEGETGESSKTDQSEKSEKTQTKKRILNKKKLGGLTLMGASSATGSSNLAFDIVNATNMSAKKKEKLEIALEVILAVASTIMAIAGGSMAMGASGGTSVLSEGMEKVTSGLKSALPKVVGYLEDNAANLSKIATRVESSLMAAQGLTSLAEGGSDIYRGYLSKVLSELKGAQSLIESAEAMNNNFIKANNKSLKSIMKEYDAIIDTFNAPALPGESIAQALA